MITKCPRCGQEENDGDLRTLSMACLYRMDELNVPFKEYSLGINDRRSFYFVCVCKDCRGEWMESIEKWWNNAPNRDDDSDRNIPVRVKGRTVMMNLEEYQKFKEPIDTPLPIVTSAEITHRQTAITPGTDEEKAALENADFSGIVEAGNNFAMQKANEAMGLPGGCTAEQILKISEKAHAKNRARYGAGLPLPPTTYLMDYQGGTITVKDVVNETLGSHGRSTRP